MPPCTVPNIVPFNRWGDDNIDVEHNELGGSNEAVPPAAVGEDARLEPLLCYERFRSIVEGHRREVCKAVIQGLQYAAYAGIDHHLKGMTGTAGTAGTAGT